MAALTALAIGGALGAGFLFGRKKGGDDPQYQLTRDPNQPMQTAAGNARKAADKVAATKPVDAVKAESANVSSALQAAAKTRRRAAAGAAGKVSTGAASAAQRAISGSGAPRSLVGY